MIGSALSTRLLHSGLVLAESDVSVSELQFLSAPPAWVTALLVVPGVLLLVGLVYRREATSASLRAKVLLSLLRMAAIFLVLLVLYQPVSRSQVFSVTRSVVAVLVDESASMDRSEAYEDELRTALAMARFSL